MTDNDADNPKKPAPQVPNDADNASETEGLSEKGGPKGPEPTRYGDWESGGRCTDF